MPLAWKRLKPQLSHGMLPSNGYIWCMRPCADGVVVIAISLFPEVPGSIPERGKTRRFLWIRLFVHAVHLLSFLRRSDPFRGITSPTRRLPYWANGLFYPRWSYRFRKLVGSIVADCQALTWPDSYPFRSHNFEARRCGLRSSGKRKKFDRPNWHHVGRSGWNGLFSRTLVRYTKRDTPPTNSVVFPSRSFYKHDSGHQSPTFRSGEMLYLRNGWLCEI